MADQSFLDWPFFEAQHKTLAQDLDQWAAATLPAIVDGDAAHSDLDGTCRKLVKASGGTAKARKYPGGREHHGTKMLEAEYGKKVSKRILRFVKKSLGIESKKKSDKTKKKKKAPKAS